MIEGNKREHGEWKEDEMERGGNQSELGLSEGGKER